ncbi:MAG: hypothetical protein H7Y11_09385, partial [Armatimonadetes bacterium]|nr:hypothetical protein [Anaerolineae bacterium]
MRRTLFVILTSLVGFGSSIFAQPTPPALPAVNPFGVVEGFWFPALTCDLG